MPSKNKTPGAEEGQGYQVVSVIPSSGGKTVLQTMVSDKGESFIRIADRSDANMDNSSRKQNRTSIKKGQQKAVHKKTEIEADLFKFKENKNHTEYATRTRAHHILYTRTSGGIVYRQPDESSVQKTTSRNTSSRTAQSNTTQNASQENGTEDNIRVYRQLNGVISDNLKGQAELEESLVSQQSNRGDNNRDVKHDNAECNENHKNFTEEADKLIREYKKKYGSRDNLDEKVPGNETKVKVDDALIKEMLKDKTVVIANLCISEPKKDGLKSKSARRIRKNACFHCGDSVYQKEKVGPIRDVLFHAQCFRCSICGTVLNLYNFYQNNKDVSDRSVYCRSHQPSSEFSKVDITDKNIQAVINKPKLGRVNSNVRGSPATKSSIGTDAVSIKNAMNVPKLGTYNPTVRVTNPAGGIDHIDHKAVFLQTALRAPKLDVYNPTVRPVPNVEHKPQKNHSVSRQRESDITDSTSQSQPVYHGSKALHSLYLHQP